MRAPEWRPITIERKPTLISVGMKTRQEITSIAYIDAPAWDAVVLACTVAYPAAIEDANVGDLTVVTLASVDLARRLAGSGAAMMAAPPPPGVPDHLLDQPADIFAPIGRTSVDVLDDLLA